MKNNILMHFDEPTDKQLIELMSEVAIDAQEKALLEKKHLSEKIKHEIINVQAQMKVNKG